MNPQNTNDTSRQQSETSSSQVEQQRMRAQDVQALKAKISHNNFQLLELTSNDQKFIQIIKEFNHTAVQFINNEQYDTGLVYLQEAEKILEYAASCGKTIDRFLIVYTLHNQASVFQKLWELQKSSDYMEAIFINIGQYIEQAAPININQNIANKFSEEYLLLSSYTHRRLSTVLYLLQYSAVSSQIGKHNVAILSVKKALRLLKQNLQEYIQYVKFSNKNQENLQNIKQLKLNCQGIQEGVLPSMLFDINKKFVDLKGRQIQSVTQQLSTEFLEKLRSFSIGQVMQIQPIPYQKMMHQGQIDTLVSKQGIIKTALYISICFYAFATQIRLSNSGNLVSSGPQKTKNIEKSKIYHSNSIRIVLDHVPSLTDYLLHILKSFKNNYHLDLAGQIGIHDSKILELNPNVLKNEQFGLCIRQSGESVPIKETSKLNQNQSKVSQFGIGHSHILQSSAEKLDIIKMQLKQSQIKFNQKIKTQRKISIKGSKNLKNDLKKSKSKSNKKLIKVTSHPKLKFKTQHNNIESQSTKQQPKQKKNVNHRKQSKSSKKSSHNLVSSKSNDNLLKIHENLMKQKRNSHEIGQFEKQLSKNKKKAKNKARVMNEYMTKQEEPEKNTKKRNTTRSKSKKQKLTLTKSPNTKLKTGGITSPRNEAKKVKNIKTNLYY